jgi:hypothetical protein
VFHILGAVAAMERNLIREQTEMAARSRLGAATLFSQSITIEAVRPASLTLDAWQLAIGLGCAWVVTDHLGETEESK